MPNLLSLIQDGGPVSLVPILFSAGTGAALLAWTCFIIIGKKQLSSLIVTIPIGLTILCAVAGYEFGMSQVSDAISEAPEDYKEIMTWAGSSVSLYPLFMTATLAPISMMGYFVLWLYSLIKDSFNLMSTAVFAASWICCLALALLTTPIGHKIGVNDHFQPLNGIGISVIILCVISILFSRNSTESESALMRSFVASILCATSISALTLTLHAWGASSAFDALANAPDDLKVPMAANGFFMFKQAQQFFVPAAALSFVPAGSLISQMKSSNQKQALIGLIFIIGCFFSAYSFSSPDETTFTELFNL